MIKKTKEIKDIRNITKSLPTLRYVDPDYVYLALTNARCKRGESFVKPGDYVKACDVIGRRYGDFFEQNIHSSVSGTVVGIEKKFHRMGKLVEFIKIKNDKKDINSDTIKTRTDEEIKNLTKEDMTQILKECALVGLGGSSFPTYIKFQTNDKIDYIMINGIECEPYLTSDYRLMLEEPDRIYKGISYIIQAFNAKKAFICIKKKHQDLYEVLTSVKTRYPDLNVEIKRVGNYYPQGWEINMIKDALGIKVAPKVLPSKYGVMNFNVSTVVGVYKAIKHNLPVIKRNFTVTGDGIKIAQNFRVRVGVSVKELIEKCLGYTDYDKKIFIMGGPMMGASLVSDDAVVTKTTTSIIILDDKSRNVENCVRCGSCVYSCPVGLRPVSIMNAYKTKNVEMLNKLNVNNCIECGLCSYTCTSHIHVTEYIRKAKRMNKV